MPTRCGRRPARPSRRAGAIELARLGGRAGGRRIRAAAARSASGGRGRCDARDSRRGRRRVAGGRVGGGCGSLAAAGVDAQHRSTRRAPDELRRSTASRNSSASATSAKALIAAAGIVTGQGRAAAVLGDRPRSQASEPCVLRDGDESPVPRAVTIPCVSGTHEDHLARRRHRRRQGGAARPAEIGQLSASGGRGAAAGRRTPAPSRGCGSRSGGRRDRLARERDERREFRRRCCR